MRPNPSRSPSDGTHAVVIEDANFKVLATETGGGCSHGSGGGSGS